MTEPENTERFVDQVEKPIPSQSTWADLSVNQLIDLKVQLQSKAWTFRTTPSILKVLNTSIDTLEKMISTKLM
jgi:hypothetical protein